MNYVIKIDNVLEHAMKKNLPLVPYKTGNLRYRGIKNQFTEKGPELYIDEVVAPYGKWINQPGYRTEGWWEKFQAAVKKDFIKDLGRIGRISYAVEVVGPNRGGKTWK